LQKNSKNGETLVIKRTGIILSIIVGVVFFKAHYWTAFSIAMVNLLVFFLLAYYFGLIFISHKNA